MPGIEDLGEEFAMEHFEGDITQPFGGFAHPPDAGDIRVVDSAGSRELIPGARPRRRLTVGLTLERLGS